MRGYRLLLLLGYIGNVAPSQEMTEIESPEVSYLNTQGLYSQHVGLPPACSIEPRQYYTHSYCPKFLARCHVVRCPKYSCLETSFFRTEAEIRSSLDEGVEFRKNPYGTTISARGKGIKARYCNRMKRIALGCDNFAVVNAGPGLSILDEETNTVYILSEIPAACGGPFYQSVLTGGCCYDDCCGATGRCFEIRRKFKFLVLLSSGRTQVKDINMTVGCQCKNINQGK